MTTAVSRRGAKPQRKRPRGYAAALRRSHILAILDQAAGGVAAARDLAHQTIALYGEDFGSRERALVSIFFDLRALHGRLAMLRDSMTPRKREAAP